jgi:hypothetical protein
MKIFREIRFYLVIVSLSLLIVTVNYFKVKDELVKCQTDENYIPGGDIQKAELLSKIDSLNSEMFIKEIQLGSYEVMWGMLEEVNKPLADSINLQVE